jgi:4-amino-4-deoxy-L-arabinose transferase-like glycosyltransferase
MTGASIDLPVFDADHRSIASRPALAALALILFAVWFGALDARGLFWPDEGRYAEIAREMHATGDYVTPRLNGLKYFEKPPLQYWFSALAFAAFGIDEWTARLWPATTGFVIVVLSVALWWRWRGPDAGVLAGSMLASAWGVLLGAQILTLDIGLTLFHSLALLAFIAAHRPDATPTTRSWMMIVVWAAMALAVLSKGLIGILLPGLALVVYAAIERDLAVIRSAFTLPGIVAFGVLAVPWFVLVQRANPEFFDLFFVQEHFRRYLEPGHNRPGRWWYFIAIGAAFLLPWTAALPGAIRDAWRAPRQGTLRPERLLVVWAVVVTVFFSFSRSKLPFYILPALPALVWLMAIASPSHRPNMARDALIATIILGVAMIGGATQLDAIPKLRDLGEGVAAYPPFMIAAGGLCVAGGAIVAALSRRVAVTTRIADVAALNVAALQILLTGAHALDAYFSAKRAVDTFLGEKKAFPGGPPFFSVEMLDQSVMFYLGRTLTQVETRGELADGIAAEPEKFIAQRSDFEAKWRALDEAYAVMGPETYHELQDAGLPMSLMATDPRRVFVARGRWPPAGAPTPAKRP